MSEELIKKIQRLIELGKGDRGRLEHILNSITQGKSLFASDQKYLDILFVKHISNESKSEMHPSSEEENISKPESKESEKSEIERLRDEVYKMQKYQMINQQLKSLKKDMGAVTLAAVLGGIFGINGIGHFILGKTVAGVAYLVGGIVAMGILAIPTGGYGALLPWIIFLITSTISARSGCREWNQYIEENLAEPGSWKDVKNYFLFPPQEPKVNTESNTKEQPEPESIPEPKKSLSRQSKTIVALLIVFAGIGSIFVIDIFVFDINLGSIGGQFGGERELTQADKIRRDCYYDSTDGIMYSRSGYKEWCPHGQRGVLDAELTWWNPFD